MPKFFPAPGSPFTADDAQEIGPELAKLAEEGVSSSQDIVDYARVHDTPLRRHLHMDLPLPEVAEKWYRHRARKIAQSIMVRIKVGDEFRAVRAFHSVLVSVPRREADAGSKQPVSRRYVTIHEVRESAALADQVLEDALSRLQAWASRYATYREAFCAAHPELGRVFEAVEEIESSR